MLRGIPSLIDPHRQGRKQVLLRPSSKIIIKFLKVMQSKGYIGEFEIVDDHASNKIVVELLGTFSSFSKGRLNKCAVISPRYDVTLGEFEQWTNNVLPARYLIYLYP
jgi:small subunit ribosomal protein S15Ae